MSDKLCSRCILPSTFPGIQFDGQGVCNYCHDFEDKEIDFSAVREKAEQGLREVLAIPRPHYEIIVAYSGGKDSSYALHYVREVFPDARVLALLIDNGFIADKAIDNAHSMTGSLGVDFLTFRPNQKAMLEIYSKSLKGGLHTPGTLKRASAVCTSCIQVINSTIINFATRLEIPVVAGGYLSGQIPSDTGYMRQNLNFTKRLGEKTKVALQEKLSPRALKLFEQSVGSLTELLIFNPLAYLNLSEEDIVKTISQYGWYRPKDTGKSSSNCLLNDYAIYHHIRTQKFHPYVAETAAMVRKGIISRKEGMQKMEESFSENQFQSIESKLKVVGV